tara:strand:+ start:1486 stop:1689 length:204 start_codon:yes stop_codon:yes gene_type:complete
MKKINIEKKLKDEMRYKVIFKLTYSCVYTIKKLTKNKTIKNLCIKCMDNIKSVVPKTEIKEIELNNL